MVQKSTSKSKKATSKKKVVADPVIPLIVSPPVPCFGGAMTFGQFYENKAHFSALKVIKGSSLTIPGQARDLAALLASAKYAGGMLPRHGTPTFDDSFEEGVARITFESLDDEQISQIASDAVESAEKKEDVKDDAADKDHDAEAGE